MCGVSLLGGGAAASNDSATREARRGASHEVARTVTRESASKPSEPRAAHPPCGSEPLERALRIIQGHQNIPAFSQHILKVMSLMGDDEASLRLLTNTILRDYSLTLAVLRRANSAYYNRSGKPICSVARAVTLMGVDVIKSLASSSMLLENYEKHSTGLKELLLLSMLTANHSRLVAQHLQMKGAEEVYVIGMFRNLGEILVACHMGEAHEKILRDIRENKSTEHEACLKVLDCKFEDIGRAIAGSWNLPSSVKRAMESSDPAGFQRQGAEERMSTIVAFSHELTNCVYRHAEEDTGQAIDHLIEKYTSIANLNLESVKVVLADAVTETKDTFTTAGIPLEDLHLRNQFQLALSGGRPSPGTRTATLAAVLGGVKTADAPATMIEPTDKDLLNRLVGEVKAAVEPGHELKLNEVLMMVLEACHRGAHFDRVVFGLATPDRSHVRGRLGLGPSIDDLIEQLQIPLTGSRDPLTPALLTKRDIFVDARHDDRYLDSPLVRSLAPSCFGLFPVVVEDVVVGCLYFDRTAPDCLPSQPLLDTIGSLRDLLAELIRRTRTSA